MTLNDTEWHLLTVQMQQYSGEPVKWFEGSDCFWGEALDPQGSSEDPEESNSDASFKNDVDLQNNVQ